MIFTEEQQDAIDAIETWRSERDKPFLTMGGLAGTGKSTIVAHLVEEWGDVAVATLSGKAAHVLRTKGVRCAQTIHSLIYVPFEDALGRIHFVRREQLAATNGRLPRLLVIDEASMVSDAIFDDLMSFDVPILFVGDHGQLEPIGRNPGLMKDPDLRLTTIHRQALGNPIIQFAHDLREGKKPQYGYDQNDCLEVVRAGEFWDRISPNTTMICGFNRARHRVNGRCRQMLGLTDPLPVEGDKLICLQNNRAFGIFNGQQAECTGRGGVFGHVVMLDLTTEDGRDMTLPCLRTQFGRDRQQGSRYDPNVALFDYGYCLTAHKAQGSGFYEVMVLEQIGSSWDRARWSYTAATRAVERLTYCC